ncbi:MAG: acyl-CoA thioesterase domain-containing protein [Nocardioides sp.]|uniref:acyl-CoA thioesterase domain-containing protein n=1 Tax=Nocardioides sp. TaxID=35761 RepID=UPI003F11A592
MSDAYFARQGTLFAPLPDARGSWSHDSIHGVAVCGLLGHAAEQALVGHGRAEDLVPARFAVELFAPPRYADCTVSTRVVRDGPRICLLDVELTQDGRPVARASATFVRASESAPGEVWSPTDRPTAPSTDVAPVSDVPQMPFVRSGEGPWTQEFASHQNGERHSYFHVCHPVVDGSPLTAFEAAASSADGVNMTTNWGSRGVEYINTDATLSMTRLPVGVEVGLRTLDRTEHAGVAAGAAAVFDREGQFGVVVCSSIANARRTVDMATLEDDTV